MEGNVEIDGVLYGFDLSQAIDISIPLRAGSENVNAWWAPDVTIEPVRMGEWIGSVKDGGSVNFRNVRVNPHGNGTHTECVGHISKEDYTLNGCLRQFFFVAQLISVIPEQHESDSVITRAQLEPVLVHNVEAVVIRTLPNDVGKCVRKYSGTNFTYMESSAMQLMVARNVKHVLIDLPSVDREEDGGALLSHHIFWNYPAAPRIDCTITELVYVDDAVGDGLYVVNVQITALENDASPSKPVLYKLWRK